MRRTQHGSSHDRAATCERARHLAQRWVGRAFATRKQSERWLAARTLREQRAWFAAIDEVQRAYPGTKDWLVSCSLTEGAGRSLDAPFVMNHQGSGAGGWLQFMESTFWRMFTAAKADVEARGFIVPRSAASWSSRLGQALAGAWGVTNGRRGEWSGSGC